MPPRPLSLALPHLRPRAEPPWPSPSHRSPLALPPPPPPPPLHRRHALLPTSTPAAPPSAPFHTSARALTDALPNHYETLHLTQAASPGEIKRQFYTLSKQHHPDRNPADPSASTRFVAISEAYHVLSVPEKRAQYDAQLGRTRASRWGGHGYGDGGVGVGGTADSRAHPQGSYSSASFAGSRPATGLNKKRGTFRGPPPSFYKAGGYGRHGAKRAEFSQQDSRAEGRQGYGDFGGLGPGQSGQGFDVPHFDGRRHKAAQDNISDYIHSRRRKKLAGDVSDELRRGGTLLNFVLVTGAIAAMGLTVRLFGDGDEAKKKK